MRHQRTGQIKRRHDVNESHRPSVREGGIRERDGVIAPLGEIRRDEDALELRNWCGRGAHTE